MWVVEKDFTFLSVFIFVLYIGSVISLWFDAKTKKSIKEKFNVQWFIANHLTVIGLLGTVIGLMVGVDSLAEIEINLEEPKEILSIIKTLFLALSTALVTTIVGLIASLLLKIQILIINSVCRNETQ
jgi:DMSO reductase anchor subunit